jgi:hypothetical protein
VGRKDEDLREEDTLTMKPGSSAGLTLTGVFSTNRRKRMPRLPMTIIIAAAMAVAVAPVANARHHHAHGKGCKGEFMYMKGGKCMDARDKKA